jgi:cytochrome c
MRRQISTLTIALAFATLLIAAGQASGQTPDGATLFKERTCIACHGADAKTPILPIYPKLAGQSAEYLLQQMQDIKSGARNNGNTVAMKGIMFLVNDEDMKILSEYLAGLEP